MSKNRRIKSEEKIKIAQKCIEGKISITEVSKQMGVGKTTVREWIAKYQAEGSLGFLNHEKNRVYSAELKAQVAYWSYVKNIKFVQKHNSEIG